MLSTAEVIYKCQEIAALACIGLFVGAAVRFFVHLQ